MVKGQIRSQLLNMCTFVALCMSTPSYSTKIIHMNETSITHGMASLTKCIMNSCETKITQEKVVINVFI